MLKNRISWFSAAAYLLYLVASRTLYPTMLRAAAIYVAYLAFCSLALALDCLDADCVPIAWDWGVCMAVVVTAIFLVSDASAKIAADSAEEEGKKRGEYLQLGWAGLLDLAKGAAIFGVFISLNLLPFIPSGSEPSWFWFFVSFAAWLGVLLLSPLLVSSLSRAPHHGAVMILRGIALAVCVVCAALIPPGVLPPDYYWGSVLVIGGIGVVYVGFSVSSLRPHLEKMRADRNPPPSAVVKKPTPTIDLLLQEIENLRARTKR